MANADQSPTTSRKASASRNMSRPRGSLEPIADDGVYLRLSEEEALVLSAAANAIALLLRKVTQSAPSARSEEWPLTQAVPRSPPVSVKDSVTRDYIVCLEDGVRVKLLATYLKRFGLTPDQYRQRWGLPHDYPMVALELSEKRADIARKTRPHLGRTKADLDSG